MKTKELSPFPPGDNPFRHDLYHMGIQIGSNCIIMTPNHDHEPCPYLIICNTQTGERLQIDLTEDASKSQALADLMQTSLEDRERLQDDYAPYEEE